MKKISDSSGDERKSEEVIEEDDDDELLIGYSSESDGVKKMTNDSTVHSSGGKTKEAIKSYFESKGIIGDFSTSSESGESSEDEDKDDVSSTSRKVSQKCDDLSTPITQKK